jgi:hypothetical protein
MSGLSLVKLAVGVTDIADLRSLQAARLAAGQVLCHRTRNFPRRAHELRDGGSLYWVIAGAIVVRQPITDIIEDIRTDGVPCAAILLAPNLVPVAGRPMKAFQGWRYLVAGDAPADLIDGVAALGEADLPMAMRVELRKLGLL